MLNVVSLLLIYSQDVRYFSEEIPVESSPGDVALWIKIARSKLHQSNAESDAENEDTDENNVTQALSTLSRGLEENTQSEVLSDSWKIGTCETQTGINLLRITCPFYCQG